MADVAAPVFKKRANKTANVRKRPATPPPDQSESDSDYTDNEAGVRIKRRKKEGVTTTAGTRREQNLSKSTAFEADRSRTISVNEDATKASNWYTDAALAAKDLAPGQVIKTETIVPDSTNGTYQGTAKYSNFIKKDENAPSRQVGPVKAPTNVRAITVTDFAPDVCKDYKQTGFCGFGDSCKFLHAREDYKQGWQLDKEWESAGKKDKPGKKSATNDDLDEEDKMLQEIPFACIICKESYKSPVVTKCGHYFCEKCAMGRYMKEKKKTCAACGADTGGSFGVARKLKDLLEKKRERVEERKAKAREAGEEFYMSVAAEIHSTGSLAFIQMGVSRWRGSSSWETFRRSMAGAKDLNHSSMSTRTTQSAALPLSPAYINTLHHSAHNSELFAGPSDTSWNVELIYPSGYAERFSLGRHEKTSRKAKAARSFEPIDDLLHSVRIILCYAIGPSDLVDNLCLRLQAAWKHDSSILFGETMDTINHYVVANRIQLAALPVNMVHHFFDQLYDRAVAPYLSGLKSGRTDFTYGELRPAFLSSIFKSAGLNCDSVYVDLGSGVGNTAMQAALETGCEAHGIEREPHPHLIGAFHRQQFYARAVLWGLPHGEVHLHFGDFLQSQLMASLLKEADLVVMNNFKFEPTTDARLHERLKMLLKVGARVVSMKPLTPIGRVRAADQTFFTETRRYTADSVSWSANEGNYYVATKMRMSG